MNFLVICYAIHFGCSLSVNKCSNIHRYLILLWADKNAVKLKLLALVNVFQFQFCMVHCISCHQLIPFCSITIRFLIYSRSQTNKLLWFWLSVWTKQIVATHACWTWKSMMRPQIWNIWMSYDVWVLTISEYWLLSSCVIMYLCS